MTNNIPFSAAIAESPDKRIVDFIHLNWNIYQQ